ncbi:MAG: hypothetical protein J0L87_10165 [Bacteroidetes bacterium]|nr:hypothetical protein [Bacteroidota bacterium]
MTLNATTLLKKVKLDKIKIELYENEIVHVTYLKGSNIDVLDKMAELEANLAITNNQKHPFLISFEPFVNISKEAKEYSITIELEQPFLAVAVVVDNLAYQIMADFYFKFYKPKVLYKVFKSQAKAIEWLLDVKNNPNSDHRNKPLKFPFFNF